MYRVSILALQHNQDKGNKKAIGLMTQLSGGCLIFNIVIVK